MTEQLLRLVNLTVSYPGRRKNDAVQVVKNVDLHLDEGETLGLVGESGSGKSTIGNAIVGLVAPAQGHILFRGRDITHVSQRQRQEIGRDIQIIFQDPYSSLNPSRNIGQTLGEPLRVVQRLHRSEAAERVREVLTQVGMPVDAASRYPAEFSGGQRQRIAIARALVLRPSLIVCDEPTSALDLSVQAQILNLLLDLQLRLGLSYLFISHDIDVVRHMSHRAAVLLQGNVVEQGPAMDVTDRPAHPYTRKLIAAVPRADEHAYISEPLEEPNYIALSST